MFYGCEGINGYGEPEVISSTVGAGVPNIATNIHNCLCSSETTTYLIALLPLMANTYNILSPTRTSTIIQFLNNLNHFLYGSCLFPHLSKQFLLKCTLFLFLFFSGTEEYSCQFCGGGVLRTQR